MLQFLRKIHFNTQYFFKQVNKDDSSIPQNQGETEVLLVLPTMVPLGLESARVIKKLPKSDEY